ncbi:MAG: hypothetical protein IBJ03_02185 [Gemmatimonadaceae bacterium]|nr:hypothetical protein [Gemmatimonadaceae bacterium]
MAAAPLRWIVTTEAVSAVTLGVVCVLASGTASEWLSLPQIPASWAAVRVAATLLVGFGILMHVATDYIVTTRTVIQGLAVAHLFATVVLGLQAYAVWNNGYGAFMTFVPFALGVRYAQYGYSSRMPVEEISNPVSV